MIDFDEIRVAFLFDFRGRRAFGRWIGGLLLFTACRQQKDEANDCREFH